MFSRCRRRDAAERALASLQTLLDMPDRQPRHGAEMAAIAGSVLRHTDPTPPRNATAPATR